jgi:hypothetical protein
VDLTRPSIDLPALHPVSLDSRLGGGYDNDGG